MIVEQNDIAAVELLKDGSGELESPYGRMHALWSLQGMNMLETKTILMALEDGSPLVRKQAVILSESNLSNQEIRNKLVTLANDSDPHVQFQLVLTLSRFPENESFKPLQTIAKQHLSDKWFQPKAVGSPSVKILCDIYHVQIQEGNLIPTIDYAWDEIAYFQIGDTPGRKEPGTGEINYKNVFQPIYNKGYRGFLGMEHGLKNPGKEGAEAAYEAYRGMDPK